MRGEKGGCSQPEEMSLRRDSSELEISSWSDNQDGTIEAITSTVLREIVLDVKHLSDGNCTSASALD